MQKIKPVLFSLGLCCITLNCATAQNATNAPTANQIILKATGPYEDMAHYAVAKKDDKVIKYLADADAGADEVLKILPPDDARKFAGLSKQLHQAVAGKDGTTAADSSVTIFRMLVDRLDASTLVVPKEVELLDFAGYKLAVLAAADKPDWQAISKLADESDAWWKAIAPGVTDKHLRATVTSAIAGMKQAAAEKNLSMLKYAAQMDLDLVDLLEDGFKSAAKAKAAAKP